MTSSGTRRPTIVDTRAGSATSWRRGVGEHPRLGVLDGDRGGDERGARVGEGEELVEHGALGAQRRTARRPVEHAAQQPHDVRPRGVVGELDEADAEAGRRGADLRVAGGGPPQHHGAAAGRGRALEQGGGLGRTLDADAEEQVAGLAEDARPRLGERHVVDGRAAGVDDHA